MLSEPPPYHVKVRDYFKKQSGVWSFFSADGKMEGAADQKKGEEEDWDIVERIMQALASHPDSDAALRETVRRFRLGEKLIGAPMELDRLDIMEREELRERTRALLLAYLRPEWIRTPGVMRLVREYFVDLEAVMDDEAENGGGMKSEDRALAVMGAATEAGAGTGMEAMENEMTLEGAHISVQNYFAYVLLDLVQADPEPGDAPLEHARRLAGSLGITPVFEPILEKEMIYPYDDHGQDIL